jgi:hypothetical protein
MKHFKIDRSRLDLIVPAQFYQMNLIRAVEQARKLDPELFVNGSDTLPSWSKFAKDVIKAKGFYTRMLQAIFLGQNNLPELDRDQQTRDPQYRVTMMFLPGSLKNEQLKDVVTFSKQALPGYKVLEISGVGKHNNKRISNRNAERITKDVIEECKEKNIPLLILSRGMAQRSYSIGEIHDLILAYDEGDAGATTQKISRVLTPSVLNKIGRIWSLSFDPNRDDKFDAMMITSAQNYAKRKNIDIEKALEKVLATVDLFACTTDGKVQIDTDTYLQQILDRRTLNRVVGKQADLEKLSLDQLIKYSNGTANISRLQQTDSAEKGKTTKGSQKKSNGAHNTKEIEKLKSKVREVFATVVEHLPHLAVMTKQNSIKDTLKKCIKIKEYNQYVSKEFKLSPVEILDLFEKGVLNYDLAGLQKSAKLAVFSQQ